ncbi:MAG: hypothetical protein WCW66_01280 [Patescibacteria group bacterium]|jgi:hypothetical protein
MVPATDIRINGNNDLLVRRFFNKKYRVITVIIVITENVPKGRIELRSCRAPAIKDHHNSGTRFSLNANRVKNNRFKFIGGIPFVNGSIKLD